MIQKAVKMPTEGEAVAAEAAPAAEGDREGLGRTPF